MRKLILIAVTLLIPLVIVADDYVLGPPIRVDFGGPDALPGSAPGPAAYVPGPALRADFGGPDVLPPFISGYDYDGNCPKKNSRLVVVGERFGSSQGSRRLVMTGGGSSLILPVQSWSDTTVTLTLPDDPRISAGAGVVYFIGIQDESGRWLANVDRRFVVCQ